jgi:hypothetical protein
MKKREANAGCEWEVVERTHHRAAQYCHKQVEPGRIFCPKHTLMSEERAAELQRKMEHVRKGKERARRMREALETSPLRVPVQ